MRSDFYVYALLDPRKSGQFKYGRLKFDFEPFYIGKGFGKRAFSHIRDGDLRVYEKRIRHDFKTNKINSIKRAGYEPIVIMVRENLSEEKAFELECKFIITIGRKDTKTGPLTNATNGGEGASGYVYDDSQRKAKSEERKQWHASLTEEDKTEIRIRKQKGLKEYFGSLSKSDMEARAKAISEGHSKRTPKQQKELSKRYKEIQRNLPEDVDAARREKLSKSTKRHFENMSEEERKLCSEKASKYNKRNWDSAPEPKRKQRAKAAATARHYDKDDTELAKINAKISNTVADYHASLSLHAKRIRNFRVMCATRLSLIGRKHDDDLRKRLYGIGDRFYAKSENLEVEPTQLRDRVVRMIEKAA